MNEAGPSEPPDGSPNVAIARGSLDAWADRDMDRMVRGWAADVVWDMSPYRPAWPGPVEYVGEVEIIDFLAQWLAAWRTQEIWPEELHDRGDRVLVILGRRGQVRASGTEIDRRWAQLWSFRDGEAIRIVNYSDSEAASRAFHEG